MTVEELRKTEDYAEAMEKIKGYHKGFKFTVYYNKIPKPNANALKEILNDCCKAGIISSIEMGIALNGNLSEETFVRL